VSTLLSKGPTTAISMFKYLAFKGPPAATLICKYLSFKASISNEQIKKSFKATSIRKNCGSNFFQKVLESPYQIRENRPTYTK